MDDRDGSDTSENLLGQSVDTFGLGLNYRPIPAIRLSVNGFLFDIDRPITDAGWGQRPLQQRRRRLGVPVRVLSEILAGPAIVLPEKFVE